MKRFRFKFEAVEKVRKLREDEALRALGEAQRRHQAEIERKNALIRDLDLSLKRREQLGQEAVPSLAFQMESEFIAGQKLRVLHADHAIQRTKKFVDKAMRAYLFARRQMRMMEVLRESAVADFKRERAKYEQREQDDLYVMRARMEALNEA